MNGITTTNYLPNSLSICTTTGIILMRSDVAIKFISKIGRFTLDHQTPKVEGVGR